MKSKFIKPGYYYLPEWDVLHVWYPPLRGKQSVDLFNYYTGGWELYTTKIGDVTIAGEVEYLGDL